MRSSTTFAFETLAILLETHAFGLGKATVLWNAKVVLDEKVKIKNYE